MNVVLIFKHFTFKFWAKNSDRPFEKKETNKIKALHSYASSPFSNISLSVLPAQF
jgi:hypothetical protein